MSSTRSWKYSFLPERSPSTPSATQGSAAAGRPFCVGDAPVTSAQYGRQGHPVRPARRAEPYSKDDSPATKVSFKRVANELVVTGFPKDEGDAVKSAIKRECGVESYAVKNGDETGSFFVVVPDSYDQQCKLLKLNGTPYTTKEGGLYYLGVMEPKQSLLLGTKTLSGAKAIFDALKNVFYVALDKLVFSYCPKQLLPKEAEKPQEQQKVQTPPKPKPKPKQKPKVEEKPPEPKSLTEALSPSCQKKGIDTDQTLATVTKKVKPITPKRKTLTREELLSHTEDASHLEYPSTKRGFPPREHIQDDDILTPDWNKWTPPSYRLFDIYE